MRSYEFYIKPGPGERDETAVPLPPPQEALIAGHVTEDRGPVEGALVLLTDQETGSLLQYTVTDALGRFWFGPLQPDTLYFLRVQKPDGPVRIVELSK
ncbi:MAG: carboxypeptidase regulatory-like domain-containing protein [Oscillospiraceae bacterium]|nr:carboxypeptidase regulatory-like domain-containing protein [Oscillospiraceae bacterium]